MTLGQDNNLVRKPQSGYWCYEFKRYPSSVHANRVSLALVHAAKLGAVNLIGKVSVLKTESNRTSGVRVQVSSAPPKYQQ